jgi:ribonuclease HI
LAGTIASSPDLVVFVDGASRSNPGPAAIGVSVRSPDGPEIDSLGTLTGEATNNEAEYTAVIRGLGLAAAHTRGAVEVRSDSKVIVNQLNGSYETKEPRLVELQRSVRAAETPFSLVHYRWVPREDAGSQRADGLANAALNAAGYPKKVWSGPKRG